jgi:hypothetical protein
MALELEWELQWLTAMARLQQLEGASPLKPAFGDEPAAAWPGILPSWHFDAFALPLQLLSGVFALA